MADPITLVVGALVAGAAAGLKPTAEQAVKDAYAALKSFIRGHWAGISVDIAEADPASESRRAVLGDDLARAGAAEHPEVVRLANELLSAVREHDADAAARAGVNLSDWDIGGDLVVSGIRAEGGPVDITGLTVRGNARLENISAVDRPPDRPPKGQ